MLSRYLLLTGRIQGAGPNDGAGFSLLELVAVIAILGALMTIVYPSISNRSGTIESGARRTALLIAYLGEEASTKKIYNKMTFDLDREEILVHESRDGKEFKPKAERRLGRLSPGRSINIASVAAPGIGSVVSGTASITMAPVPSVPFEVRLTSEERSLTLSFNPYTGKVSTSGADGS